MKLKNTILAILLSVTFAQAQENMTNEAILLKQHKLIEQRDIKENTYKLAIGSAKRIPLKNDQDLTARTLLAPSDWFITEWKTDNSGPTNDNEIHIRVPAPLSGGPAFFPALYDVDWEGNGVWETGINGSITHTYSAPGTYEVRIRGEYPYIAFNPIGTLPVTIATDNEKILKVKQWGTQLWKNMRLGFNECPNLEITATDIPNLGSVAYPVSMNFMFSQSTAITTIPNIETWDTSHVVSMRAVFNEVININQEIGNWNTSQVIDMAFMFNGCENFTGDISYKPALNAWDTSLVVDMQAMFQTCRAFDQNIGNWNTSSVEDISWMFNRCDIFNQDVSYKPSTGAWNTLEVTTMSNTFANCKKFDKNIGNWNTSKVEYMNFMFFRAFDFSHDIGSWNTSQVKNTESMFSLAWAFNHDISYKPAINAWDTSEVTNMKDMFYLSNFNQNIGNWKINKLIDATDMFKYSDLTLVNYDNLLIGWDAGPHLNNVPLGAHTDWCQGNTQRTNLAGDGWIFTDGVLDCSVPVCTRLNTPLNGTNDVSISDRTLVWDLVSNATSYHIIVGTTLGANNIADVTVTTNFYTHGSDWLEDQNYFVSITPVNNMGSPTGCLTDSFKTECTPITSTFTQVAPICAGETLTALSTTSLNGITGTWSPALDNTTDTTYTFTPNVGQCVSTTNTTMEIIVNPLVAPTFTQVSPICAGETLTALPTTSLNGIMGIWSPALDNTTDTTYTFTPNAGQCVPTTNTTMEIIVNPLVAPTFTQVSPICAGETLTALPTTSLNGITGTWSPALDNTTYTFIPDAGQCVPTTNTTMDIIVNPLVVPTFTQVSPICAGETLTALPTTSLNGITGTWSPALDNSTDTTYTFTPNVGQCVSTANTTMGIIVNPLVAPIFTQVAPICAGETLTALATTSLNGITGAWSPDLDNTTDTTYTFIPDASQCVPNTTMDIIVNPIITPAFTQVTDICAGEVLSDLPTVSSDGIAGTWSPAMDNTTTTLYTFTPSSGICTINAQMTITVNPLPLVDTINGLTSCESYTLPPLTNGNYYTETNGDGIPLFAGEDITTDDTIYIYATTSTCSTETSFNITIDTMPVADYISNLSSCESYELQPLTNGNYFTASQGTGTPLFSGDEVLENDTIYIYISNGSCWNETTFNVHIDESVNVDKPNDIEQCGSYMLPILSSGNYFEEPNGMGNIFVAGDIIEVSQTIYVYKENGSCFDEHSFEIIIHPVVEFELVTSNLEIALQDLEINMDNLDIDYLYSVDNSPFQVSNEFLDLSDGAHVLIVSDENGCISHQLIFETISYIIPPFFTPNHDGYNDYWNVKSNNNSIEIIYIMDRFGKVLTQFSPYNDLGWDGTYSGKPKVETDYWYFIQFYSGVTLKGNFTLKRTR